MGTPKKVPLVLGNPLVSLPKPWPGSRPPDCEFLDQGPWDSGGPGTEKLILNGGIEVTNSSRNGHGLGGSLWCLTDGGNVENAELR